MVRKPRDYDAELQALMEKAKKVKSRKRPELTNWPPGTHKQTKCERHAARG